MTNSSALPKALIIFGIVLPLAAFVGYLLATPQDFTTIVAVVAVFGVMAIPLILKWHHPLLVFSWNAAITLAFLPGGAHLWVPAAAASLGLAVLNSVLNKDVKLVQVKSVTWTLLAFAVVVLVTAKLTGGMGVRSLGGSSFGGKKYFLIFFAVMGYFALSTQRIPLEKAYFYGGLFTLSGLTNALTNLIYRFPSLWFLYAIVPVDFALSQAIEDFSVGATGSRLARLGGIGLAAMAGYSYMLMKYGVRGVLDTSKWWRAPALACLVGLGMLGGFRSILILCSLLFALQYCLEGLLRSRWTIVLLLAGCVVAGVLVGFSRQLPIQLQRSLSVLPLDIDPAARADALASTDWRIRMWKVLWPEVPKYFFLGKGFTANASDYFLAAESSRRGLASDIDMSMMAGDYHNGPLSIIIPFGIWGLLAFLGFNIASIRVLYLNYRYTDPPLRTLNTFLFASFLTRFLFFYFIYGAVQLDLATMVGLVGFSISVNGGVKKPSSGQEVAVTEQNAA